MFRYHHRLLPSIFDGYFHLGTAVLNHYARTLLNYRSDIAHARMKLFSIHVLVLHYGINFQIMLHIYPTLNYLKENLKTDLGVLRFKLS